MNVTSTLEKRQISKEKELRTFSEAEEEAINLLFSKFIIASKYNDHYIAEDLLIHLVALGSSKEEAISNLMMEIEEHIQEIKRIKLIKEKGINQLFKKVGKD